MEEKIITFTANEQGLVKTGGISHYASDTISYIKAVFTLGENWNGFDEVRAVFKSPYECRPAVLDSNGECYVPVEVLFYKGKVRVNLVGSIVTETEITDRLTTYSVEALDVDEDVPVCGEESQPISPSEYEQFVAKVANDANRASQSATDAETYADEAEASAQNASESASASAVSASDSARSATASAGYAQDASEIAVEVEVMKNEVELAKDKVLGMRATAETLEAGSDATASYSDGLLTLGIPRGDQGIQGIQGETGATPNLTIGAVETLEPTEDATATITGTAEEPILNLGIPKGDTGEVSLEDLETLLPTETASGSIVTITDGQSVVPAKSLKVQLEPIQAGSGTPSPDNVRPISGRTEAVTSSVGKNWSPTASWSGHSGTAVTLEKAIPANTTITVSSLFTRDGSATNSCALLFKFSDGTYSGWYNIAVNSGQRKAQTVTLAKDIVAINYYASNNGWSDSQNYTLTVTDFQLELGSTATDYEAFGGQTYTTTLGRTVYGGTLDVVSGELVVDRAMVDLGTLNWAYQSSTARFIADLPTAKRPPYNQTKANIVCSALEVTTTSATEIPSNDYCIGLSRYATLGARYNATSSVVDFKTAMSGVQLCYELATPQTYQLTPQEVRLLLGTNNIWSDGNVTLVYNADIQKWVEKKLNGNSTTLTMSRPMVQTETEETE